MNAIAQCPWCDEPLDAPVDAGVENAENFCRQCSAPLFWAPSEPARRVAATTSSLSPSAGDTQSPRDHAADPALRRPELKGVRSDASVPCWQCLEPNQQVASSCHRCGARIPPATIDDEQPSDKVPQCGATSGVTARRRFEVPAWILVGLGVVLVALAARLIWLVW